MLLCNEIFKKNGTMWASIERTMLPATAYSLLALSSVWCFLLYIISLRDISLGFLTFGFFFALGIFGTWEYVNIYQQTQSRRILTCFKIFKFIANLYCLPVLVADLYLKYNFSSELAIAHLILPLLALVPYGTNPPADKSLLHFKKYSLQNRVRESVDFVMFCSVVSLSVVSTIGGNFPGVAAAFVYAVTRFLVTEEGYIETLKMPAEPVYISGMGVFCLLGMRAMIACPGY